MIRKVSGIDDPGSPKGLASFEPKYPGGSACAGMAGAKEGAIWRNDRLKCAREIK